MEISSKLRIVQTFNFNVVIFCLGLECGSFGVMLLDLAELYETTADQIAITMTTRSAGSIVAGLTGHALFQCLNTQIAIAVCILATGVSLVLMPLLKKLVYLHAASVVFGLAMSYIEIGGHVWMQVIWKERCGPVLQLTNLIFGIGGIIAPLICEPFLSSKTFRQSQSDNTSPTEHLTSTTPDSPETLSSDSRIAVAYFIIGGAFCANAVSTMVSYCYDSTNPVPEKRTSPEKVSTPNGSELTRSMQNIIVALAATYVALGVMLEASFSGFMPTFVVSIEELAFTKSSAAYLASVFWMSFTASRVIVTSLSFTVGIPKLMMAAHVALVAGTVCMVLFGGTSSTAVWLGTVLSGLGIGPVFGNGTVWAVQYTILTHGDMSVITLVICGGFMIPALLFGRYIETVPMVLCYGVVGLAALLTCCAAAMLLYGRRPHLREVRRLKLKKVYKGKELRGSDEIQHIQSGDN